jgi:hypothetical protein
MACRHNTVGNTFTIDFGGGSITGKIRGTGGWDDYRQIQVASIKLKPGLKRVTFQCSGRSNQGLIDLRQIFMIPNSLGVLREAASGP